MFSQDQIKSQLEKFSIAKGKIVTIHSSLKAVGEVEGGGEALLSTLIDYFTESGGLFFVPAFTWRYALPDMRTDETCVGALSKLAAGRPDRVRSIHPTHSVSVFGDREKALEFVKDDEFTDTLLNPKGCYGKLYDEDGYVLLMGVGHDSNTFLHCVEEILKVPNRVRKESRILPLIREDGVRVEREMYYMDHDSVPGFSERYWKFEPAFRYHGAIIDGFIGNAPTQLCNARKMKEVVELILNNNNYGELLADDAPIDEKLYK